MILMLMGAGAVSAQAAAPIATAAAVPSASFDQRPSRPPREPRAAGRTLIPATSAAGTSMNRYVPNDRVGMKNAIATMGTQARLSAS